MDSIVAIYCYISDSCFLEDSISNSDNKLFITSIIFLIGILILINSNFMCLGMVEKYLSSKKIELEEEMNIAQIKLQYDYYKNEGRRYDSCQTYLSRYEKSFTNFK